MNFTQELKRLNKEQRQAVEAIEGPVMVVAGPGTGKTQILTLRIANILKKTDTSPESILALTFTEAAAGAMRARLAGIIGEAAYRVSVKTIHGFCNELIQQYPEKFPMISGESNISEVDQIKMIRSFLPTNYRRFAREMASSISQFKREGIGPKDVQDDDALADVYKRYQAELQKRGQYDYDDMVLSVANVLKSNKNLRLTLRETYLYILVDEHQDTNRSQNKVIELLAGSPASGGHDSPNLFVVGDAKQAIYRFQGASLENFSYFKKRFKSAVIITLTNNYRSTQTILDAALDIAREGPLTARTSHPKKPIGIAACSTSNIEPYVVSRLIEQRIKSAGVAPEQIAVLYRTNKDSADVMRYLQKLGIGVSLATADEAFQRPDVRKLLLLLEAVRDFGADHALLPVLYLDIIGVAPLDVALLVRAAREQKSSVFSLIRDPKTLKKLIPHSAEAVFKIYTKLSLWRAMSKSFSLMPMLEALVLETGLIQAGVMIFGELKEALRRQRTLELADFLEQLEIMREHRVGITVHQTGAEPVGVQLLTAHKSKGLEFEYVYILGATSANWEGKRKSDLASERNLFYVALTRAKKEAVISYGKTNGDNKMQQPSVFVSSIRPELVKHIDVSALEAEYRQHPEIEFRPLLVSPRKTEREFFRARFLEKGLSPSGLNNYLDCPAKFYFLNLVGLEESPHARAQAGNAAHAALRYAVEARARTGNVSKQSVLDRFKHALAREPMREVDYREAIKTGEKALGAYFNAHHKEWNASMKCEYAIDGVNVGEIPVRGRLDRIDVLASNKVRVIDYKFKKPMTRNEILGKTKNSNGHYYRQLTFYKLLVEQGTNWKMTDAVLDFLLPSSPARGGQEGRFKQEVFAPSDKEIAELIALIKKVSKEILSGDYLTTSCGETNCKYCDLREIMSNSAE